MNPLSLLLALSLTSQSPSVSPRGIPLDPSVTLTATESFLGSSIPLSFTATSDPYQGGGYWSGSSSSSQITVTIYLNALGTSYVDYSYPDPSLSFRSGITTLPQSPVPSFLYQVPDLIHPPGSPFSPPCGLKISQ